MSQFEDNLWGSVVEEHGADLARTGVVPTQRARRTPSHLVAGGSLGVATLATVGGLMLSTSATTPAFAVTSHGNGSVSVKINRTSGIAGANRKLAAMGVHERIVGVSRQGLGRTLQVPEQSRPVCYVNAPGQHEVAVLLNSVAQERATIHGDTWTDPYADDAGNTGGSPTPNTGPYHVDACYANTAAAQAATGGSGSGNSGNTGAS